MVDTALRHDVCVADKGAREDGVHRLAALRAVLHAIEAERGDKKRVTMEEFEEGVERVIAGLEKQTRIIHEDEKLRVAYHECGHALVASVLPNTDPVHKISIIPRGYGALGYTMHRPDDEKQLVMQSELENQICCLLGGILAEEIIYQEEKKSDTCCI